jgi:hypothetical protein
VNTAQLRAEAARLFRRVEAALPAEGSTAPEAAPAADGYVQQLATGMEEIRAHLRRMGTGLAAAGGVILAGLGYAQVHQTFPLPEGLHSHVLSGKWLFGLGAALAAFIAAVGAIWLAARFFGAQRRIPMSTDYDDFKQELGRENQDAIKVLNEYARAEEASVLLALDLRADRFDRLSRRLTGPKAAAFGREAARLYTLINTALVDASYVVLERRSEKAFREKRTALALLLAVVGILALFGLADYSKGRRDLIDLRSRCQQAVNIGATDACDSVRTPKQSLAVRQAATAEDRARKHAAANAARQVPKASALYSHVLACMTVLDGNDRLRVAADAVKAAAIAACASG